MKAYAICDGEHLMERAATGQLQLYYALDDAVAAYPCVKAGAPKQMQPRMRVCSVTISKPKQLPPRG